MNWHLLLDVVAWAGGMLGTLNAISAILVKYDGVRPLKRQALISAIAATLCWAWNIAS